VVLGRRNEWEDGEIKTRLADGQIGDPKREGWLCGMETEKNHDTQEHVFTVDG